MKYGLPYKGSKNKLAPKIFELFPKKKNFYDLFCGGCAMTHYGMLNNSFENFIINDLNPMCSELFIDAINGKYRDEKRWISREDFLNSNEPYVKFVWSFGNNLKNYLYSKEIEPWKKALHYARVYKDFSLFEKMDIHLENADRITIQKNHKELKEKYISWYVKEVGRRNGNQMGGHYFGKSQWQFPTREEYQKMQGFLLFKKDYDEIYGLQDFMQSLQSLQSLQRLECFSTDYQNVEIKKDSVIYCDIPYEGTDGYTVGSFDVERFYSWCEKQTEPLFISSYKMPEDRFVCVATFEHRSLLSATTKNKVLEKVFIPKHQKFINKQLAFCF